MPEMNLLFDPNKKYRISLDVISQLYTCHRFRPKYSSPEGIVTERLKELLKPDDNGKIDGNAVKNVIFPTDGDRFPKFDVFISHSHNDIEYAETLAQYLRTKGKTPFLDNYVWSSADGLLMQIDNKYCLNKDESFYLYDKRNFSTSHVHSMLSMAILEMIARCELFIFIESEKSIDYAKLRDKGNKTQSPWLYQELQYVRMLSSVVKRSLNEQREFSDTDVPFCMTYGAELSDFQQLTAGNINDVFKEEFWI